MKKLGVFLLSIGLLFNLSSPAQALPTSGPGDRIHGIDISKWQHPYGKSINFVKMAKAGISFVMIKGGDGHDPADATALNI